MFRETDETITEAQFINLSYVQAQHDYLQGNYSRAVRPLTEAHSVIKPPPMSSPQPRTTSRANYPVGGVKRMARPSWDTTPPVGGREDAPAKKLVPHLQMQASHAANA
eukprot:gene9528-12467_t